MLGKVAGGLAALGLIGGVGHVVYHDGSATVKIKDSAGHTQSADIGMGGQKYRCPRGEHDKLDPYVERAGRIQITLRGVNVNLEPSRYNALVDEYNRTVDEYNSILHADCSAA